MNHRFYILAGLISAATLPVLAQSPTPTPSARLTLTPAPANSGVEPAAPADAGGSGASSLTESELLRQLEAIGTMDPVTHLPRGAVNTKPGKGADSQNGGGSTEITAQEATFDQKQHVGVFIRDVFVENPEFTVNCDKLTAYMHHQEKGEDETGAKPATGAAKPVGAAGAGAKATPKPATTAGGAKPAGSPGAKPAGNGGNTAAGGTPAAGGSKAPKASMQSSGNATQQDKLAALPTADNGAPKSSGGLEKAICEGNVLILQDKIEADGSVTHNVGRGRKAIYEADTGNITLYGNPQVEQGVNVCTALKDDTVMVLNRNGHMEVYGVHKTTIIDGGSAPGGSGNAPGGSSTKSASPSTASR